jgi:hypothetical protein
VSSKRSPTFSGGAFCREGLKLEKHFEGELRIEGFASAYAGGSVVVADGVVESEVAADGDIAAAGRCEVISVEEVEHLCAELNGDTFFDLRVFEDREIDVRVARTVVSIASRCTKGALSRIDKGSWI